ncbi:DUF6093 family protein [Microbacterium sp. GXF6406]
MSILTGALTMGRRAAEMRMTDTVDVFSRVESEDPVTLKTTFVETKILTSIARLSIGTGSASSAREQGGQIAVVTRRELHLPVAVQNLDIGLYARVTASASDTNLVGRTVRIVARPAAGQTTAHRYDVEEVRDV